MNQVASLDSQELDTLNLTELDTPSLKALLNKSLSITAKYLSFLGRVWRELEARGEDLSELRTGLTRYLPMIGEGKLDPNIVIRFAGQQLLLRELALMPLAEQQRLAAGEKIPMVTQNSCGDFVTEMIDVASIHARHYSQLFHMGHLRTETEQKTLLSHRAPSRRRSQKIRKKKVSYDPNQHAIKCGTTKILIDDVLLALSDASGKDLQEIKSYLNLKNENP